jgi:hypothetical protein
MPIDNEKGRSLSIRKSPFEASHYMTDRLPGGDGGLTLNAAFTDLAAVMVTTQAPVPVHAPVQPANVAPAAAVAVKATEVPGA